MLELARSLPAAGAILDTRTRSLRPVSRPSMETRPLRGRLQPVAARSCGTPHDRHIRSILCQICEWATGRDIIVKNYTKYTAPITVPK
jgi:hypothetical protein